MGMQKKKSDPDYGVVVVFSGPSGAGKTTVYKRVLAARKDLDFSVSCTTRLPRQGEVDGEDYFFLCRQEFVSRRDRGDFLESAEVHGNFYGTLRSEVEGRVNNGLSVLLDIDVQGARLIRQGIAGTDLAKHTVFVFTAPPDAATLEKRLRSRGTDDEACIAKRLADSREELAAWTEYDYLLINDTVDQAVADFTAIIEAALKRPVQWQNAPWRH